MKTICEEFARILDGRKIESQNYESCAVTLTRDLEVKIFGKYIKSPLVLNAHFSFESMDSQGRTLNFGETVILPCEINPFICALRQQGIEVTAVNNHWLFLEPRLMNIHFFSLEPPLSFARKVSATLEMLRD